MEVEEKLKEVSKVFKEFMDVLLDVEHKIRIAAEEIDALRRQK